MVRATIIVITVTYVAANALFSFAGPVQAGGGWQSLSGPRLGGALAARTIALPDGQTLGFFADGRVLSGWTWGQWWLEGPLACLSWPKEPVASCYEVARRGIDLRFSTKADSPKYHAFTGRYIDLN